MDIDIFATAFRQYYWKPMTAFFRSFEISYYINSKTHFEGDVLDLACGDGGVAVMLKEIGVLTSAPVGLDFDRKEIQKARTIKNHKSLVLADANNIPFKDETFLSIFSNAAVCSIPGGVERSLKEVYRVLKKNGYFVLTVPTDFFNNNLLITNFLENIGSKSLAKKYGEKIDKRVTHFNVFSCETWQEKLKETGFEIDYFAGFFPSEVGKIWNILEFQIMRFNGLFKLPGLKMYKRILISIWTKILKGYHKKYISMDSPEPGYIFIRAKKP